MRTICGLVSQLFRPVRAALDDLPFLCDCDEHGPCAACEPG